MRSGKQHLRWFFAYAALCAVVCIWFIQAELRASTHVEAYIYSHEYSPMLAMPGASPSAIVAAAQSLRESAALSILPFSDDPEGTWHVDVYPTEFLNAAANAEEARRIMHYSRTLEDAEAYHHSLLVLLAEYDRALTHTIAGLSVGRPTTLTSFSGTTSAPYIVEVLEKGRLHVEAMGAEESRRYTCLRGNLRACFSRAHWSSHTSLSSRTKETELRDGTPPTEILKMRDALRVYEQRNAGTSTELSTMSLDTSQCYPSYAPIFYDISVGTSTVSDTPAVHAVLLSDVFFYELKNIPVRFSQAYQSAGATYSYQPFNAYICQDAGIEMGRLLSVRYARASLSRSPLSLPENTSSSLLLSMLFRSQEAFLSEATPTEASYQRFIRDAERLVASTPTERLVSLVGAAQAEMLRTLILDARTHTANFELIVGYFDDLQGGTYVTGKLDPYRTSVFFMLRGGISPLLMLGNETGPFGKEVSLLSERADRELHPKGFMLRSYVRDLRDRYSLEELLTTHVRAHNAVFEPIVNEFIARRRLQ